MFKIGDRLTLEYQKSPKEVQRFYCRIVEVKDGALLVDSPINEKTKKTAFFMNGTSFIAVFVENNQVYRFETTCIKHISGKIKMLMLTFPGKDQMKRIQRRNYVRVPASLDVAIRADSPVPVHFTTLTSDIGGGGILIHLPKKNMLSEDGHLTIWLVLPMSSGLYCYIKLEGKVVRVFADKNTQKEMASIQFNYEKEKDREPLIRYCFERELQTRRMALKH